MYNILLLGSGGREHSIAWALSKDKNIKNLYCAPGNAGTSSISENINLDILNNLELKKVNTNQFPLVKILNKLPKFNSLYETAIITINDYFVNSFLKKELSIYWTIRLC